MFVFVLVEVLLYFGMKICIEVESVNERYIDCYVRVSAGAPQWCLTCIYGEPRVENRHHKPDTLLQSKK